MNTSTSATASGGVSQETFPRNPLIASSGSAELTLSSASAVLALLSSQSFEGLDARESNGVFLTLRGVHEAVEFARRAMQTPPARGLFRDEDPSFDASLLRPPYRADKDEWGHVVIRDAAGRAVAFMRGGTVQDKALAAHIVCALITAEMGGAS